MHDHTGTPRVNVTGSSILQMRRKSAACLCMDWCAVAYTDKDRVCHIFAMQQRSFFLFKLAACASSVQKCANHGIRQNEMSCSEANLALHKQRESSQSCT